MTKFIGFSFLMLFGAMLVFSTSCKKDETTTEEDNPPTSQMTAKIDGETWTATTTIAQIGNGILNITGLAANGETLTITLIGTEAKTYTLDQLGTEGVAAYIPSGATNSYTTNGNPNAGGTVIITKINLTDSIVSGTFQFVAVETMNIDEKDITEGSFSNIKIVKPQSPTDSELKVDIDGTTWEAPVVMGLSASGKIILTGSNTTSGKSVMITMPDNAGPGTYDISFFGNYSGQYNASSTQFYTSESGSITITEHDDVSKTVKGTFEFLATDSFGGLPDVSLTNGSFDVSY